jgi:hypothetical protein
MNIPEKYDKIQTGIIPGFVLPFLIALVVFLVARGDPSLHLWLRKIVNANILTHVITLCVFPNVLVFLLFNHFDMLKASKGVLGVTIFWAVIVFGIYFLL